MRIKLNFFDNYSTEIGIYILWKSICCNEDEVIEKIARRVEYDWSEITYFLSDAVKELSDTSVYKVYVARVEAEDLLEPQNKSLE